MKEVILTAAACIILAGIGVYIFRDRCDEVAAYEAVQLEMAQYLKAPSTAIYQPWEQVSEQVVPNVCMFTVAGYVESQNSFGAMGKTTFSASTMRSQGEYRAFLKAINGKLPGL